MADAGGPLYPDVLGFGRVWKLHSVRQRPLRLPHSPFRATIGAGRDMGMIGFDIVCEAARSGPRMRGYLVNALRKKQVRMLSAPTSLSPPKA